jgi:hypothetical protein
MLAYQEGGQMSRLLDALNALLADKPQPKKHGGRKKGSVEYDLDSLLPVFRREILMKVAVEMRLLK